MTPARVVAVLTLAIVAAKCVADALR